MVLQYSVPVMVLDSTKRHLIEHSLKPYKCFSDERGNLKDTSFSRKTIQDIGELYFVKTLNRDAAQIAHQVLSGIEGLLVLPINEKVIK